MGCWFFPVLATLPSSTALSSGGPGYQPQNFLTYVGTCLHGVSQVTHQQAALIHSGVVTAQAGEILEDGSGSKVKIPSSAKPPPQPLEPAKKFHLTPGFLTSPEYSASRGAVTQSSAS